MLVLSRRLNEKVVLPGINTTLQITDIKRGVVRLGIVAPPAVAVFRDEVWQRERHGKAIPELLHDSAAWSRLQELGHLLRNRLNAATIGLALLRRQLQVGLCEPARQTLERLEQEFEGLGGEVRRAVEQGKPRVKPPVRVRKALLVEDDQNERELLAGFLRLAGLDV